MHPRIRVFTFVFASVSMYGCTTEPALAARTLDIPPGWEGTMGTPAVAYDVGLDRTEHHGGRSSAYMRGPVFATPEFAIISQSIRADDYLGKRVRWSAWIKGRALVGPIAGLWMRVDGAGVVTGYDNMGNRPDSGTTDWHQVSVVLDVPTDALGIQVGAMRRGGGVLFIDDMKLEIVGTDVPSTNTLTAPLSNTIDPATTIAVYLNAAKTPTNTDFERLP